MRQDFIRIGFKSLIQLTFTSSTPMKQLPEEMVKQNIRQEPKPEPVIFEQAPEVPKNNTNLEIPERNPQIEKPRSAGLVAPRTSKLRIAKYSCIDSRASYVEKPQNDIFDLFDTPEDSKPVAKKEQSMDDMGLSDLLNIDFTKQDIIPEPRQQPQRPSIIKTDNPLTNDILSLYNAPVNVQPNEESKEPEGIQFNSIISIEDKFFVSLKGKPIADDSALDDLFGDFSMGSSKPAHNSDFDKQQKINEKKEIIELISFKVTMIFLEKILIVLKNNQLSEGKCMGHIGLEFGGFIDPEDSQKVTLNADFSQVSSIWDNPQ